MRKLRGTILLILAILQTGCAATKYSDGGSASVLNTPPPYQITARVNYDKNPAYLPRSLISASSGSALVADYVYEVNYGMGHEHVLTVFNPLLIAGMSKTEDSVFIGGQLKIYRGDQLLRKYEETVTLSKGKTLYSEGDTLTEIRKQGLLHVRDKIDEQVYADKAFWQQQTGTGSQPIPPSASTSTK
ncbi:MAG: hypothetical protein ACYDC8_02885 [Gammaproteobacteria bacterium]